MFKKYLTCLFPVDGGKVHYVLGNHETMVMAGDNRYVRRKYLELADALNMNLTHDIFGMAGEFGRWMRTKNIMVKIGDILFVHGGIRRSDPIIKCKVRASTSLCT